MSNLKKHLIRLGNTNPELRIHLRPILDKISSSYLDYDWSKYDLKLYESYLALIKPAERIAANLGHSKMSIGVKKPWTELSKQPCLYVGSRNTQAADEVAQEIEIQFNMKLKKARDYGGAGVTHKLYFKTHKI